MSIGTLQLAWATGYKGSRADYISEDVICFKCGGTIQFVSEGGVGDSMYVPPTGVLLGSLAVHGINKLFAYSENNVKPKICIHKYPSLLKVSTLADGAQLEYLALTFSVSDHLASISGVPDYQLIVWKYADQTKLCVQELTQMAPIFVSFNPGNWRQLATGTTKELTVWNIEQSDTKFLIKKQKLSPAQDETAGHSRLNFQVPKSAIAGLSGDDMIKFEDYRDELERMIPVSLSWLTSGDLVVGCKDGQLIKVDVENNRLTVLALAGSKLELDESESKDKVSSVDRSSLDSTSRRHAHRRKSHFVKPEKVSDKAQCKRKKLKDSNTSIIKEDEDQDEDTVDDQGVIKKEAAIEIDDKILPGSLNCMALHQKGLFVAGNDGALRILQIAEDEFSVVEYEEIGASVTSLSFNPSHHMLALGSSMGSVHLVNPGSVTDVQLLFDVHFGNFFTACGFAGSNDYCVTARDSGEVQVWNSVTGKVVCSLSIGVKASCVASSPLAHMVIVGSETGYAYMIDFNKLDCPNIVHSIHLHRNPIHCIVFNETGQFFLTGSKDGFVFVVDGRPSKHFEPVGYISCQGHVRGIATFMKDDDTRVVVTSDVSDSPASTSPANKLMSFCLPADLLNDLTSKHKSLNCEFKDEIIGRLCFDFPDPVFGIALTDSDIIYTLCSITRQLQKYHVPHDLHKKVRLDEEVPEAVAKSVISSRLDYRRRRQQVISPAITSRRRMSVIGAGMSEQYGTGAGPTTDSSGGGQTTPGASGGGRGGGGGGGGGAPEGAGRRMSIFGSMAEQGPPPEPLFIAPEHKEVSSLDLLKIRRASMAEGQMSGIMKLVSMMKASESLIDKDTSEALAAQEAEKNRDPLLQVVSEQASGHQLTCSCISMSPHHKWVASGGTDGQVIIRTIESPNIMVNAAAHSFWYGGLLNFSFSPDCQLIFTSGFDGALCCFKWNYTVSGHMHGKIAVDAADSLLTRLKDLQETEDKALMLMESWRYQEVIPVINKQQTEVDVENEIENLIASGLIYNPPPPVPPEDATWEEIKRIAAQNEEEKKFADDKLKLRIEIRSLRGKLHHMMRENETAPEDEKLANHEFDLEADERKKLQEQCETEVQKLREEKEFQNIANMYLTEFIRKDCWDDMMIKGRGIVSFNKEIEVHNYPMKERTKMELRELEVVQAQRRIEIAELQARKEIVDAEITEPKEQPSAITETVDVKNTEPNDPPNVPSDVPEEPRLVDADELKQNLMREKCANMGSKGFEVGGDSDLLHSQFELSAREQKYNQIVLLQDAIYRIRLKFNKEFDEVFVKKEQAINKIKEKNQRIRMIFEHLNVPDEILDPELGPMEKREMLLTTTDDEVKVEKYLTPEEWKQLEEDQKKEEERRLKDRLDNWRERGLDKMMGGILEIKKEDELKKDIPIPEFMKHTKEEDWNEEERILVDEYRRKVKALEEEREKFRKQLDVELKKLQSTIAEEIETFEDSLHKLFMNKVKAESVIYQEELMILRLRYSMLTEEEILNYEKETIQKLEQMHLSKQAATAVLGTAKKELEDYRDKYDIHVADNKVHERMFRREFQGIPTLLVDQLFRHYKKRLRGQRAKTYDSEAYGSASLCPFSDRPSTAMREEEARNALNHAMAEFNHERNIPEGVDNQTWEHLCAYRLEKIEKEIQIKKEALTIAEMQTFVQKRQEEEEKFKVDIKGAIETLNRIRESRQIFNMDIEVQLILQQGLVEVDPGVFIPNYKTALLIHRNIVEELNKRIQALSKSKIASMVEIKDFHSGILALQWEHKKMKMEMEDLKTRMRAIISMKVTRQIQAYLAVDDYETVKNREIASIEKAFGKLEKLYESKVEEKRKEVDSVKKSIVHLVRKNNYLESELEKIHLAVHERRGVYQIHSEKLNEESQEQRYRQIKQKQKLIDLAKAQAQEIDMLRTELERLRMRNFPVLVRRDI